MLRHDSCVSFFMSSEREASQLFPDGLHERCRRMIARRRSRLSAETSVSNGPLGEVPGSSDLGASHVQFNSIRFEWSCGSSGSHVRTGGTPVVPHRPARADSPAIPDPQRASFRSRRRELQFDLSATRLPPTEQLLWVQLWQLRLRKLGQLEWGLPEPVPVAAFVLVGFRLRKLRLLLAVRGALPVAHRESACGSR